MPLPTPDEKNMNKVKELRSKGLTFRQIAKLLDSDLKTVYRWFQYTQDPTYTSYSPDSYQRQKESQIKAQGKYRSSNPDKVKARKEVFKVMRTGSFLKKPCEVCGSEKSEAHHPDHKKPLKVVWLCKEHHKQAEKKKLSTG